MTFEATDARFEAVERLADAVLYEGYVLYPYRASAIKNQVRWQFGIAAPRAPSEDGEPWFSQTECLVEPHGGCQVRVRIRCLRPGRSPSADSARPSSAHWLDGSPTVVDVPWIPLDQSMPNTIVPLTIGGLSARLLIEARPSGPFITLHLRLENLEPWRPEMEADRSALLCQALTGLHLLLAVDRGAFVSLLDPPIEAAALAAQCHNQHTWPVLVGDRSRRDMLLSAPIILYDFPTVAEESPGDLCDATEIDEILTLRVLTLTDEEKQEARATGSRASEIITRVEQLAPEAMAALHGTMRSADFFNPHGRAAPEEARIEVGGVPVRRGSRVRLRPNRRADVMDLFLSDQVATVAGIYHDVDDRVYVAVTVNADPAAELHEAFGRFFYFDPSEIEPMTSAEEDV